MQLPSVFTEIRLAKTPEGMPTEEDFACVEVPLTAPGPGEVLCRTAYLSLDPYMRSQIAGRHLSGKIAPGDPMNGETVSEVLVSNHERFKPGDIVRCFGGWRSHSVHDPSELNPVPPQLPDPRLALSTFGMPGLTAWAGLSQLAAVKPDDTVVIPAAIGGVGAVAGQLARHKGCRVIGIAGSDQKCQVATGQLGYHDCINRKAADVAESLKRLCPDGISVYFDLVGGELLTTVSEQLAVGARIILCGLMAEYNNPGRAAGPPPGLWIRARATVFGLVVYDFEGQRQQFIDELLPLYQAGTLQAHEDVADGLERAPARVRNCAIDPGHR